MRYSVYSVSCSVESLLWFAAFVLSENKVANCECKSRTIISMIVAFTLSLFKAFRKYKHQIFFGFPQCLAHSFELICRNVLPIPFD